MDWLPRDAPVHSLDGVQTGGAGSGNQGGDPAVHRDVEHGRGGAQHDHVQGETMGEGGRLEFDHGMDYSQCCHGDEMPLASDFSDGDVEEEEEGRGLSCHDVDVPSLGGDDQG